MIQKNSDFLYGMLLAKAVADFIGLFEADTGNLFELFGRLLNNRKGVGAKFIDDFLSQS